MWQVVAPAPGVSAKVRYWLALGSSIRAGVGRIDGSLPMAQYTKYTRYVDSS